MTTSNPAKLKVAQELVNRFRQAGRPAAIGNPPKRPSPQQVRALQTSPSGWPVTRDALASQLTARLGGKEQPSQVATSYCGPAAFLYCLLEDRPDLYVAYATSMWTKGEYEFGSLEIDVDSGTQNSLGRINYDRLQFPKKQFISSLDWITMASLSLATREWFVTGDSARPDDLARSITYPWVLKGWYGAVGAKPVHDSMGVGLLKQGLRPFLEAMHYWNRHWLVLQIDSSLITGGDTATFKNRHWVVVDPHTYPRVKTDEGRWVPLGSIKDKIVPRSAGRGGVYLDDTAVRDWEMDLRLVTWGKEGVQTTIKKLSDVSSRFYGALAFPRLR